VSEPKSVSRFVPLVMAFLAGLLVLSAVVYLARPSASPIGPGGPFHLEDQNGRPVSEGAESRSGSGTAILPSDAIRSFYPTSADGLHAADLGLPTCGQAAPHERSPCGQMRLPTLFDDRLDDLS
jgi:hypothetical protein